MLGWLLGLFCHVKKPVIPVADASTALIIGQQVAHEKYQKINYANYNVVVYDHYLRDNNRWVVSFELPENNGEVILGGGGPEVHIRKTDGKILYVGIQR